MRFFLGTHSPNWLESLTVPLFVSHARLRGRRSFPVAAGAWALDSGGFTEVAAHGGYRWSVDEYAAAVERYASAIGRLEWAAPMDWMCEPFVVERTGLSVEEHQRRTVQNYLELRGRGPFIPVLQGWTLGDYERCVALYEEAGVDLAAEPLVGVGSVCRRQATEEIGQIMMWLSDLGLSLHGFGVKKSGLRAYGGFLTSADSMAWSSGARLGRIRLPGCGHATCANCSRYALKWRAELPDVQLVLR